jgi:hypothetical protein
MEGIDVSICLCSQTCPRGGMVDTRDLKSLGCKAVPVRVRPRAPTITLCLIVIYALDLLHHFYTRLYSPFFIDAAFHSFAGAFDPIDRVVSQ